LQGQYRRNKLLEIRASTGEDTLESPRTINKQRTAELSPTSANTQPLSVSLKYGITNTSNKDYETMADTSLRSSKVNIIKLKENEFQVNAQSRKGKNFIKPNFVDSNLIHRRKHLKSAYAR